MRRTLAVLSVLGVLTVASPSVAASGSAEAAPPTAGEATILRVKQPSAGAQVAFGDCPDSVQTPPEGTVCRESFVIAYRETRVIDGGSNAPSQAPWIVAATTYTLTFGAPDTDPVVSDQIFGDIVDPSVASSDREHLSTATVVAQVPMSDGSTFDFRGVWTAISDRYLYGNDGPVNADEGLPRHYVDKCTTINDNAHQKYVDAAMSGTLNGQPVHTYSAFPSGFIFYNHFVYVDVTHGDCV